MTRWEYKVKLAEEADEENEREHKIKLAKAIRKRAKEEQAKYYEEHLKGYCPKCHMLRAMNGSCNC